MFFGKKENEMNKITLHVNFFLITDSVSTNFYMPQSSPSL